MPVNDQPAKRSLRLTGVLGALLGVTVVLLSGWWWSARQAKGPSGEQAELNRPEAAGNPAAMPAAATAASDVLELHYEGGELQSRSERSGGVLHGESLGWYLNGQLQIREQFKHGVSHGLRTKWYADGTMKSQAEIVDGQLHGVFTRWNPDGTLAQQATFKHGKPDGTSVAYYPSGCVKTEVVMDSGQVIERTSWPDGELRRDPLRTAMAPSRS